MTGLIALVTALGEILSFLKQAYLLYQKAKLEGWIEDGKAITDKILAAKSDDERKALVRALSDHANSLH